VNTVNFLCDAPSVRAISFVGGNAAGEHIFDRGTKNGKRVQVKTGLSLSLSLAWESFSCFSFGSTWIFFVFV
jgi:hypothetical protein